MHKRLTLFVAALCLSLAPAIKAAPAGSQAGAPAPAGDHAAPPAGGPPMGRRPQEKPKNLQVLPEDADLRKIMRGYEGALGVECEYCHYKPAGARRPDFPSDENKMKEVARYMIKMTDDLNDKYLPQLPKGVKNVDADAKLECGTCHRGHAKPEAFVPPPRPEGRPGGPGGPGGAMQPGMPMQPGQGTPNSTQPIQH